MRLHIGKMHKEEETSNCDSCEKVFESRGRLERHIKMVHDGIASPDAKKQKQSLEEMDIMEHHGDLDAVLAYLEKISWEESRLEHRNVEINVNEDELEKMEEYDEDDRKCKVEEKLKEDENKKFSELKDEKVLKKQTEWFEQEVRYQEMKKKYSEEKEKEDLKRKRQMSCGKKKKSKSKKKEKSFENEENKKKSSDLSNVKDIPEKLEPLFNEVDLNRKDYKI